MTDDARERLIALKLARQLEREGRIEPAHRGARGEVELSFAQEALWFVEQLGDGSGVYNSSCCARLVGEIDEAALAGAVTELVRRHEALRTGFALVEGRAVARLADDVDVRIETIRAVGDDPAARDGDALRRVRAAIASPFRLEHAPLVRAVLVETSGNSALFALIVHHLVVDGTSMAVLADELGALYRAARAGMKASLPPAPLQYPDFAAWQRRRFSGQTLHRRLRYWTEALAGLEPLPLPADRARPARPSDAGRTIRFAVGEPCAGAVDALARQKGATPFVVLAAAFKALLSRYCGTEDVTVGVPVAGRTRPEMQRAVGFFVNSLVLRSDLSGDPTFADLVERVRRVVVDAFEHQDAPFDRLVSEINPHRDIGRNPLYQVSFALDNQPAARLELDGIDVSPVRVDTGTSKFDLSLTLVNTGGGYEGRLEYATDLFDEPTIERLSRHFARLLAAAVDAPDAPLSTIDYLDARDWSDAMRAAEGEIVSAGEGGTLADGFERQVASSPDALAVVGRDRGWTYRELADASDAFASRLSAWGVASGDTIALCAERSVGLLAAILGVIKAGGVYLPIDPATPAARMRFIVEDSGARWLLADAATRDRIGPTRAEVAVFDDRWTVAEDAPGPDRSGRVEPADLAYVVYTSGTSGEPKGTEITHASICNHARWFARTVGLGSGERILLKSSIGFDASLAEIFAPLMCGATVVVADEHVERDPAELIDAIARFGVTVIQFVPSSLSALLSESDLSGLASVRYVVCGGEALDASLARQLLRQLPRVRMGNFYGPTEACVDAACFQIDPRTLQDGPVPIGRPVANTRCRLLDRFRKPVPDGVPGEIYIGGAGIAVGYRNRPELSGSVFVDDPYAPGQRLYATGDIARRDASGNLVYLGRKNGQIKLRGFRIEPAEIESVMSRDPGIAECAVLAIELGTPSARLVGYVVPRAGRSSFDSAGLRRRLAESLPDYMIPSGIIMLDRLPLTRNGKIDRSALESVVVRESEAIGHGEAPRGEVESMLASLWCELLGRPGVDRNDDFFAIGGHSLLAVKLVAALRGKGYDVGVRAVFAAPTLMGLAGLLVRAASSPLTDGADDRGIPAGCTRIEPAMLRAVRLDQAEIDAVVAQVDGGAPDVQDILPLLPLQAGIIAQHVAESAGDGYLGRWVLRCADRAEAQALVSALRALCARHDALRTSLHWEGSSTPVQVVHRRVELPVEEVAVASGESALAVLRDVSDPARVRLDLTRPPLLRVCIAASPSAAETLVAVLMHHAVIDHQAEDILIDELRAYRSGMADALPLAPPLRRFIGAGEGDRPDSDAHFGALLADVSDPTLPFDLEETSGVIGTLDVCSAELDAAIDAAMRARAASLGCSVAVLVHVAWARVVAACCGSDDVVFGTVLSGRAGRPLEADRVVGMFINTLPVRARLAGRGLAESIAAMREQLADLMLHQDADLGRVMRLSGVAPHRALFNALLNYRHSRRERADPGRHGAAATIAGLALVEKVGSTHYRFGLSVDDFGDGLRLAVHVDRRIDARRILAMTTAALAAMSRYVVEAPDLALGSIDVLAADEATTLDAMSSGPRRPAQGARVVHRMFGERVAHDPERVALQCGREKVSYAELDAWSNRIARELRRRGAVRGTRVGLCVERGPAMVAAQLAVLKSGAAYVPLDPAFPPARLRYMLQDAQPAVLVGQASLADLVEWPREATLRLDDDAALIDAHDAGTLPQDDQSATPDDAAYLIYTSGSTGSPKGVAIPHRAVSNFLRSMHREPGLLREDRLLAVTTLSFDIAVLELLLPLTVGATVVLAGRDESGDGALLKDLLQSSAATVMQATPSMWRMLIDAGWSGPPGFKALIGGEALPVDLADRLLERCGELWNMYGPTETTVWSTCCRVHRPREGIAIGRPIDNTTVRVLDALGQQCPIGVAGEIGIGGDGVALGYWERPSLTAERFVTDRWSAVPGAKLYLTGDRGRWRADGSLEHLGRLDFQVKVRGHRIELGEIEAALTAHGQVAQSVVVTREDRPGDVRLVAYLVPRGGSPAPDALRAHLRRTLPEFMVPQHFVTVQAVPLLPNGKVDRKALPSPTERNDDRGTDHDVPWSAIESSLAQIWSEVLDVRHVERSDFFYDLGGHSLLAVQVAERAKRRLGIKIERSQLIYQTLAQIAASFEARSGVDELNGGRSVVERTDGTGLALLSRLTRRLTRLVGRDQP